MQEIPEVTMQFRAFGESMKSVLLHRQDTIAKIIEKAVDDAIADAPQKMAEYAAEEAAKAIREEVRRYFGYGGPGNIAIREAIEKACEPIRQALLRAANR